MGSTIIADVAYHGSTHCFAGRTRLPLIFSPLVLIILVLSFNLGSLASNDIVTQEIHEKSELKLYEPSKLASEHLKKDAPKQQDVFEQRIPVKTRHKNNTTCLYDCSKNEGLAYLNGKNLWQEIFKWTKERPVEAQTMTVMCNRNIKVFYGIFAEMTNATIHYLQGKPTSKISDIAFHNQRRASLVNKIGTLEVYCRNDKVSYLAKKMFPNMDVLATLPIQVTNSDAAQNESGEIEIVSGFSIAVTRDHLQNTYDTVTQLYNIFLMHKFFGENNGDVLVVEFGEKPESTRPKSELDDMLQVLFGPVVNIKKLPRPVQFDQLIFPPSKGYSPFEQLKEDSSMPFLEEFRDIVLSKYELDGRHSFDCRSLNITLIWRRDRPDYYIERKIFNEAEIYQAVMERYPSACVQGVLFDVLPMKEQLQLIQHTDLLIGMHGEELAHALFLPVTSAVIELIPLRRQSLNNQHVNMYKAISKWRNLHYAAWQNKQAILETLHYFTVLDVPSVMTTIDEMIEIMCRKERRVPRH